MKKLYISIFMLSATLLASAANYFVPGTVWEYEDLGGVAAYRLVETDRTESEGIYQESYTREVYDYENKVSELRTTLGALMKIDGEKVYAFVTWGGNNDWQLLYDFSLKPRDGCWIRETVWYATSDGMHTNKDFYFKYVGDVYNKWYGADMMKLLVFRTEEDSVDDSNSIFEEHWIRGIGSVSAFFGYYMYPDPDEVGCTGYFTYLKKVTDAEGNVIVESRDPSGIEAVEAAEGDAPAQYFDLQGRRVANPGHGLYILRQGAKASKVLL